MALRIRIASNTRRKAKERTIDTMVKIPPIAMFCVSVTCSPKNGKIRICVATATPYPAITLAMD